MSGGTPVRGRLALLSRYRETFAQAWRERHHDPAFPLTMDEAEFSPPALALTQRPVSPTIRVTAALLIALVAVTLAWSALGRIDIDANAVGRVIPSARTKTIASVETAVVRAIYVREGQRVKADQELLALDARPFLADYRKALAEEHAAQLARARSSALIFALATRRAPYLHDIPGVSASALQDARRHLMARYLAFTTGLATLQGRIEQYARAVPVARQRERIYARLLPTKDVSRDAWLAREQALIDLEGRLREAKDARTAFIARTRRAAYDDYSQAAEAVVGAREDAVRAASHASWLTLRSPVNGTVQQLAVHTVGGVVPAAQPLMLVVPAGQRMEVQAYLANKDVGFVRVGQKAQVKVAAFDYTRYGTLAGRVVSVSRDALVSSGVREDNGPPRGAGSARGPPRYLVRVALQRSTVIVDGRLQPILPGMAVTVEIKTGKRRVLDYFLSPLLRQATESLHER